MMQEVSENFEVSPYIFAYKKLEIKDAYSY